jgi:pSer/pThr/pTyr-binding forkhead associated (FHA) protein
MPARFCVLTADDASFAGGGVPSGGPSSGPAVAREVVLDDGLDELRLGRRADLELPLPFPALSAVHARVRRGREGWSVEDLGSRNGTWLDGERLPAGEPRPLVPGSVLRLADVRVRFEGEAAAAGPAEGTRTIARRLVNDLFSRSAEGAPSLRVVRGADPRLSLSLVEAQRPYTVGRADACDLPLPVEEVSREHAAFVRTPDGVRVRDLGSKNGVLVAGARIQGEQDLADGAVVEVGPVTLTLDDPIDRYLRELRELERAPLPLSAAPSDAPASDSPGPSPAPSAPGPAPRPLPPAGASPTRRRGAGAGRLIAAVAVIVLAGLIAAAAALLFARTG